MKTLINGQTITEMTTIKESNGFIMRKGRTSLLATKIMLFALLKIENRTPSQFDFKETQYYNKLLEDTRVNYMQGLVAEIDIADLRKILKKKSSGSFYASLRELFGDDSKSIRNAWSVMLPSQNSGVLGYAEIITACHYDSSSGKMFLKFNSEEFIKSQIWQLKSEYSELPFMLMMSLKSLNTFRIAEIITSQISIADAALIEMGGEAAYEYSFKYSLGELQFMLGALDITNDKVGRKMISEPNPDYNKIAIDVNSRQKENLGDYRGFRRYSLDTAVSEINSLADAPFTVSYDVEREGPNAKVTAINFFVKKKHCDNMDDVVPNPETINLSDFIVEIARELNTMSLTYGDLKKVAIASSYDKNIVIAAKDLYNQLQLTDNFAEWFVKLRS